MGRAITKNDLIKSANDNYNKLIDLLEMNDIVDINQSFTFPIEDKKEAHWRRDKNVRDVLIHLYEWHQLVITWIMANMRGENKSFLPSPYNWKTYGQMNIEFWEKHQGTSFEQASALFKESHINVMKIINNFTNDELFAKGSFKWTGGSTLGSYCVSATASHYDWAVKKIKMHISTLA